MKLNLRDNWMGPEGAGYVAEMLRENCYVSDLVSEIYKNSKIQKRENVQM
jgi:hypothetical protein